MQPIFELQMKLKGTNNGAKNQIFGKISLNIWLFRGICVLLHDDEKDRIDSVLVVGLAEWLVPDACRREVHDANGRALGGYGLCVCQVVAGRRVPAGLFC